LLGGTVAHYEDDELTQEVVEEKQDRTTYNF